MVSQKDRLGIAAQKLKDRRKAYLFIGLGVLCVGTGPIFVKFIHAAGSLVGFYRLLFASLFLTLPVLIRNQRTKIEISRGAVKWAILGGIAFSVNLGLWSTALSMTTASKVTLLDNTAPIWVGLFGWLLFGKREGWLYWVGLIITFLGAGLMINISHFQINSLQGGGDILGMLCGFTYAIYLILASRTRIRMDGITYSWIVACSGAVTLFLVNLAFGVFSQPLSPESLWLIFAMAISSQVLGWILINHALGLLPVAVASVVLLGQPIVTTILGIFILSEVPSLLQAVGGVICLSGIFIVQKSNIG
jgi:drug/metabolite transporter (DMT)-like permease